MNYTENNSAKYVAGTYTSLYIFLCQQDSLTRDSPILNIECSESGDSINDF
jgi:hypothetical protein